MLFSRPQSLAIGVAIFATSSISGVMAGTPPAIPALTSNGGTLRSFSDAVNLQLKTDADYGRFVDPQIVGSDRRLAIFFLKLMPANKRGDFAYVNPAHKVLSNRLAVAAGVRFLPRIKPAPDHTLPQNRIKRGWAEASARYTGSGISPDNYPPTGGSGGAYIRTYSAQGVNASYGYAIPPCDVNLPGTPGHGGDSGNMYFNAYNSNGSDVVDAGIGANNTSNAYPGLTPQQTSTAFITPYQTQGWTNQSQLYPCGQPVGIMYGTLPNPNQGLSALMVGVPSYDPSQMGLPPTSTTWTNGAWNFFNTNSQLLVGPGSWNGIPSNCMQCSIARMVTIAQPGQQGYSYDGSCFGYCTSAGADAFWYENVSGELIPQCSQVQGQSATCTIEYTTSWVGGEVDYGGSGVAYAPYNDEQAAEGINLNGFSNSQKSTRMFSWPLPTAPSAPCTVDSYGLCAVQASQTLTGSCDTGVIGLHGQHIFVYTHKTSYYIFRQEYMLELLETAIQTGHFGNGNCLPITFTWSPAEPEVTYNDPNLP